MATRGEWYATKIAAQGKANSLRRQGHKPYIRKALRAKPGVRLPATNRKDQILGWSVNW